MDNINQKATKRAHRWFKEKKGFFLPSVTFDIIFLKARIAILHPKGFEILDLTEYVHSLPMAASLTVAVASKLPLFQNLMRIILASPVLINHGIPVVQ